MHTITLVPGDLSLTRPARWLAALFQQAVVFRALGAIAEIEVRGSEQLGKIRTPCVFVANHSSHLDTLCIMRALPWSLRLRIAVPAAADYWFRNPLVGALASLLFNLVPLRRAGCPFGDLKRAGKLLENGWSLIIFP